MLLVELTSGNAQYVLFIYLTVHPLCNFCWFTTINLAYVIHLMLITPKLLPNHTKNLPKYLYKRNRSDSPLAFWLCVSFLSLPCERKSITSLYSLLNCTVLWGTIHLPSSECPKTKGQERDVEGGEVRSAETRRMQGVFGRGGGGRRGKGWVSKHSTTHSQCIHTSFHSCCIMCPAKGPYRCPGWLKWTTGLMPHEV